MKKIICNKPCTIGGEKHIIGDEVLESRIDKARLARLVDMKLISVVEVPDPPKEPEPEPRLGKKPEPKAAGKRGAK